MSKSRVINLQISITQICDKTCSWCCLGIPLIENPEHETLENLEKISVVFPKVDCVVLIGGEPTIHPQFDEICRLFSIWWPSPTRRILLTNKPPELTTKYKKWFASIISNPILLGETRPRDLNKVGSGLRYPPWCFERGYRYIEQGKVYPCCSFTGVGRYNSKELDYKSFGTPLNEYDPKKDIVTPPDLHLFCSRCSVDTHNYPEKFLLRR
jgi:MoaA/NifB/PqqE/SkfB family radical SAM enzyme